MLCTRCSEVSFLRGSSEWKLLIHCFSLSRFLLPPARRADTPQGSSSLFLTQSSSQSMVMSAQRADSHKVPPAKRSSKVWLSQGPGTVNDAGATARGLGQPSARSLCSALFATSAFVIALKHKCNYCPAWPGCRSPLREATKGEITKYNDPYTCKHPALLWCSPEIKISLSVLL